MIHKSEAQFVWVALYFFQCHRFFCTLSLIYQKMMRRTPLLIVYLLQNRRRTKLQDYSKKKTVAITFSTDILNRKYFNILHVDLKVDCSYDNWEKPYLLVNIFYYFEIHNWCLEIASQLETSHTITKVIFVQYID